MVNPDMLQTAIAAHASWKARLRAAIGSGKFDIPARSLSEKYISTAEAGRVIVRHGQSVPALPT